MANIRDYNESDDVEQPDEPDDDEDEPADEAEAEWDRIINDAENRGGTRRGEVIADIVEGRRLS